MKKRQNFLPAWALSPIFGFFCVFLVVAVLAGCKNQTGTVMKKGDPGLSGSHKAGQEVYKPLVEESVMRLLAQDLQRSAGAAAMPGQAPMKRVCFVGVENKSAEEMGDFREQMYEMIDRAVSSQGQYITVGQRFVEPAMRKERLRMDDLFIPANQRSFQAVMEQQNMPFDYLLFAKLTSGTTVDNKDSQRDYMLTLELIHLQTGDSLKEGCDLSKAYNRSMGAKIRNR